MENVILDRDGTIIEEAHYLSSPEGVRLLPGSGPALKRLQDAGFKLYILSNQSGVGRGYFSLEQHEKVQGRLRELLLEQGVRLSGERFCFHAPEEACTCRKPAVGLWAELAARYGLAAGQSVMIGDKADDIAFARRSGLKASILVLTGYGRRWALEMGLPVPDSGWQEPDEPHPPDCPTVIASDLLSASAWLVQKAVSPTEKSSGVAGD